MAKTFRNLYARVCSFENLWLAYTRARRGKRYHEPAAYFDLYAMENLRELELELREKTYLPGGYYHFYIHEPKRRKISAAPFRDRVVHHAIVNVLEPLYEARFSGASYACRKGKGTHAAVDRAHWGIRNCRYFLKGDIVKFFPSVDHELLKYVLFRKIADRDLRELVTRIIDSGAGVLTTECPPMWFPGDELLAPAERAKGLPIGNLTSQFFANVLLNELDQFVHAELKPREYVRYCDDFLLFDDDKAKLQMALGRITQCLAGLRLQCHPHKTALRLSAQGVRFLGFRLTPSTRRVDRKAISRFRARMRRYRRDWHKGTLHMERVSASVRGWLAHVAYANSSALVREVLNDVRFSKT